jgi:ATP-binding cassette subfamily B protein
MTTTTPQPTLRNLLIRLWRHLSKRRQRQLGLLLVLMLASAFSEVISLGAVLPFIGILTAPEKVFNNAFVKSICESFGITSANELVLPLTVIFVCAALLAGGTRLLMLWVSTRLSNSIGADLSIEIYKRTLYQPYKVHVARNSSEVINGITNKSWNTVTILHALLSAVSSILLSVALVITLISIDPLVIIVATIIFGVCYGGETWLTRSRLCNNSQRIARESTNVVKVLQAFLERNSDLLLIKRRHNLLGFQLSLLIKS